MINQFQITNKYTSRAGDYYYFIKSGDSVLDELICDKWLKNKEYLYNYIINNKVPYISDFI